MRSTSLTDGMQSQVGALEHRVALLSQDKDDMAASHANQVQAWETVLADRSRTSGDTAALEHTIDALQHKLACAARGGASRGAGSRI